MTARHAGVIVPLFAIPSSASWGVGEIPDLVPLARWLAAGGFDRLMLLPVGTLGAGVTSPYSAASTLSIDPLFVAFDRVEDFARAGGVRALSHEARDALAEAREAGAIRYDQVRTAKQEALDRSFGRFVADEWRHRTWRAASLAAFAARERWWLDDYALFMAAADRYGSRHWSRWPAEVRERDARALGALRRDCAYDVLRHQYGQWIADSQWQAARDAAHAAGVRLTGDLPFVASGASADVWSRQQEFRLDVSTGVPPDAFSATGQDWGLPFYHWPAIELSGYEGFRLRMRRMASLFDGVRVDHLVGLYRTYGRLADGHGFFSPASEADQLAQGEAVLTLMQSSGLELIAEDLGTIPDFVYASLARLGLPGCRVLRWQRNWHASGHPFIDPAAYPPASAAMTGTHDTEPLCDWWRHAPPDERAAAAQLPVIRDHLARASDADWGPMLRDAWLRQAYVAGSRHLFLPVQDVFGWAARINTPGTVGDHNWTWRLPWPSDSLSTLQEPLDRVGFCRALATETGRGRAG